MSSYGHVVHRTARQAGAHQMEPPSLLISWVNPFPSRFINRTIFFCNALESHECGCCLLSFLYFHWFFPLSARETSPGNRSIYKSTRERVDCKGLYGRRRLHLMGSWTEHELGTFSGFQLSFQRYFLVLPCNKHLINRAGSVCMGQSWPRSLPSVCTGDHGQDSPIQTSHSVNKNTIQGTMQTYNWIN